MLVLRTPVASFLAQIDVARESVIMLYCILCTSSYNVFYVYIGACIAQSPYPIDTSVFPLHFVRRPRPRPPPTLLRRVSIVYGFDTYCIICCGV